MLYMHVCIYVYLIYVCVCVLLFVPISVIFSNFVFPLLDHFLVSRLSINS